MDYLPGVDDHSSYTRLVDPLQALPTVLGDALDRIISEQVVWASYQRRYAVLQWVIYLFLVLATISIIIVYIVAFPDKVTLIWTMVAIVVIAIIMLYLRTRIWLRCSVLTSQRAIVMDSPQSRPSILQLDDSITHVSARGTTLKGRGDIVYLTDEEAIPIFKDVADVDSVVNLMNHMLDKRGNPVEPMRFMYREESNTRGGSIVAAESTISWTK